MRFFVSLRSTQNDKHSFILILNAEGSCKAGSNYIRAVTVCFADPDFRQDDNKPRESKSIPVAISLFCLFNQELRTTN